MFGEEECELRRTTIHFPKEKSILEEGHITFVVISNFCPISSLAYGQDDNPLHGISVGFVMFHPPTPYPRSHQTLELACQYDDDIRG